eukprot:comp22881_c0_seq1/m.36149 comp22881_c0_seq1/g.36149  ORF comp22881_c0_seq1/g.36149 comp22881_c0_seq1/m.36149 type:complete len:625 (-) comp22881_c0_seq1:209-2083(-)
MIESTPWVEIVEDTSQRVLYVNKETGECLWELPPGIAVRRSEGEQWWELYDERTKKFYYYNKQTKKSVWVKPQSGDIVPLSKLQELQARMEREGDHAVRASQQHHQSTQQQQQQQAQQTPVTSQPATQETTTDTTTAQSSASASRAVTSESTVGDEGSSGVKHSRLPQSGGGMGNGSQRTQSMEELGGEAAKVRKHSANDSLKRSSSMTEKRQKSKEEANVPPSMDHYANLLAEQIEAQKVGGLFKKKQTLDATLAWSKNEITGPLTKNVPKENKKEAVECFRNMLIYMGDRPLRKETTSELAQYMASQGYLVKQLRDELFVQLVKQMTANPNELSVQKGWELMAILLTIFPPSHIFTPFVESFIYWAMKEAEVKQATSAHYKEVYQYASFSLKKLRRMAETGVKRGKEPSVEEIEYAKNSVKHPSMFGTTIEDVMGMQHETKPLLQLPWCVTTLCDAIVKLGGLTAEGIFRVPGDVDMVNSLKVLIDQGKYEDKVKDPNVPASLLKLWFRELHQPLISDQYYEQCVEAADDTVACIAICNKLPAVNRKTLMYTINFLQKFVKDPENVKATMMDADNIAMVWAPNFLRCPSQDPMKILEKSRREKLFVKQLICHWDTHEIISVR